MRVNTRGRGRMLVAAATSAALVAGGSALTTGPAAAGQAGGQAAGQAAEPAGDCAVPFPVAEVVAGAPVTGRTVTSGTTPDDFGGEVLGVVRDGIAPGVDMVMARLTGSDIDRVGIWQGMSGSPVYAADGRLIGAVAYGLAFGPSTVAGITPFEHMDDYLGGEPTVRVDLGDRAVRAIARHTDVTTRQASQGFAQLPMPMSVSGASRLHRDLTKRQRTYLLGHAGGAAGTTAGTADTVIAGGNLAATVAYGDITSAAIGTVTSVCRGEVVGFGHPMVFAGRTSLGLSPAEAVYVQEDPVAPGFKVANVGAPVGTITDDRLTGISGAFGAVPPSAEIRTRVSAGARSAALASHSLVPASHDDIVFTQALANHDRTLDAITGGTELLSYRATGTDASGEPFEVAFTDRYQSDSDISFDAIWEMADATSLLGDMRGVRVEEIAVDSRVSDDAGVWQLRRLEVRRGREWVRIGRRTTLRTAPGRTERLRVLLASPERTRSLRLRVTVPRRARPGFAQLEVIGGASTWNDSAHEAQSPQELATALAQGPRNDQVQAVLGSSRRGGPTRTVRSAALSNVVSGHRVVGVRIGR